MLDSSRGRAKLSIAFIFFRVPFAHARPQNGIRQNAVVFGVVVVVGVVVVGVGVVVVVF